MARIRVTDDGGIDGAFERATAISARVLKVPRVGIWLFEADGRSLRCAHLHGPEGTARPDPRYLDGELYPKYVDALKAQRWLASDDVESDPMMAELWASYLKPLGIRSMLDAPLFRGSELVGVVCHEHTGEPRHWTTEDRALSGMSRRNSSAIA